MFDSLGTGSHLKIKLKIQNVGFGNMTKKRPVTIMLRSHQMIDSSFTINDKTIDTLVYAKRIELKLENDFDPQTIYSRTMTKDTIITFDGTNEFEIALSLSLLIASVSTITLVAPSSTLSNFIL